MTRSEPSTAASRDLERDRKAEHIRLALQKRMQLDRCFFDDYVFEHEALPELDLADVDVGVEFLGKRLAAPLLISCMTGGTDLAAEINRNLARAAEATGVAIGVGSQRKAFEDPSQAASFQIRDLCPSVPLLGNLGAVQLNYGFGIAECQAAVDMIEADALALHLNVLQEAIQPEGQVNFASLMPRISETVRDLRVPVIVKEIGCGISAATARRLADVGVEWIDTAGLGGTSWARIEARRADDTDLGELFSDWGIPTPDAIVAASSVEGLSVIGSGGVRNGKDVAKALALGSDLVGMAFPFLEAAMHSSDAVAEKIERTVRELRICMFCAGARTIPDLKRVRLHKKAQR